MLDTLQRYLNALTNARDQVTLRSVMRPLYDRYSSQCLTSGGLRIKGASASAIVQAHTAIYALADGVLVTKAADTDMAALSGTVVNATYNVFAFYIDSAGTLTSAMGTAGATLAAVKLPPLPEKKALIGAVLINPTGTGDFVGGTTVLDDGTVVPGAVFFNFTSPFDQTAVLGS